jgi:hypothetical protein
MTPAAKRPLTFTPMKGLLALLDRAASALGVADHEVYRGEEGLRAVAEAKLGEIGVPVGAVPLMSSEGGMMTPRQVAEQSGFIRRRKRVKQ